MLFGKHNENKDRATKLLNVINEWWEEVQLEEQLEKKRKKEIAEKHTFYKCNINHLTEDQFRAVLKSC